MKQVKRFATITRGLPELQEGLSLVPVGSGTKAGSRRARDGNAALGDRGIRMDVAVEWMWQWDAAMADG